MKYVVSDLHGCYDAFKSMLRCIRFLDEDEMYVLGDVVDRGPEPIRLLQFIRERENMTLLMGNHEYMMHDALTGGDYDLWMSNGGVVTARQFYSLPKTEQDGLLDYVYNLPMCLDVSAGGRDYVLVHAGADGVLRRQWETKYYNKTILWRGFREMIYGEPEEIPGRIVVAGHIITARYVRTENGLTTDHRYGNRSYYDGRIITFADKRLIDCGCVSGHALGCLCLDNGKEYYVRTNKPQIQDY